MKTTDLFKREWFVSGPDDDNPNATHHLNPKQALYNMNMHEIATIKP